MSTQSSVTDLKGVGVSLAEKLAKLGITTTQDLLFHLPFRYQDRTRLTPLGRLKIGDEILVEGIIVSCDVVLKQRRSLLCMIRDHAGVLGLRFYYFNMAQKNNLVPGTKVRCYGQIRHGSSGFEMYHPEYQRLIDDNPQALSEHLTPVYPTTEGLTQKRMRGLVLQALVQLKKNDGVIDWLPPDIERYYQLPSLIAALLYLHEPPVNACIEELTNGKHPAQRRLAFEELLAHHLSLLKLQAKAQQLKAPQLIPKNELSNRLLQALPFQLTNAQNKVYQEIDHDIQQVYPMLRLLQGDVGSGKTVIAALAAMQAIENNYQAAIMAPTELLAEQHFQQFLQWCEPLGINVNLLTGKLTSKQRQEQLIQIADGEARIIIGTHALFQNDVIFAKLGLIVVDEQHRFGVHQRLALREKGHQQGVYPHQLIMTATPIPRTLAMSVYADLDCSIIDELPPGRTPVKTVVLSESRRPSVIQRINQACESGRQAYWVCTLIDESEVLQCQAAEATAKELTENLPNISVGLVHGRMNAKEKNKAMSEFKCGEVDLLVATTVIEVGVDVPNASLMIIENPERLGLSQLHQLRGRVGRGEVDSYCVLLYQEPLSYQSTERLAVMRKTNDGFIIAEKDLALRGPGEVLGTKQTGMINMKIADLTRDADLLERVKLVAQSLLQEKPDHIEPLIERWLGQREEFGTV